MTFRPLGGSFATGLGLELGVGCQDRVPRGRSSLPFLHHNALRDVCRSSQNTQSRTRRELVMVRHFFVIYNHSHLLVQTVFSQCIYPYPNFCPQYPLAPPRPGPTFSKSLLRTALDQAYGTIMSLPLCAASPAPRPARPSCPPPPRPGRPPSPPAPPSPTRRRTRPRPSSHRRRRPRPAPATSAPRSATTASASTTTAG
jgi:hypothetical protein